MKTIKLLSVICAAMAMLAVSCNTQPVQQSVEGTVVDATMNNVMIVTASGDTVNISSMDADPAKVEGVMPGEEVLVTYMPEKIEGGEIKKAVGLTVIKHIPAFYITGTWVEPNPIDPAAKQGLTLNEDRSATSVGMATLLFKSWDIDGDMLILKSESIGNRQTIEAIDTMHIVKIDADSLILRRTNATMWRLARD